MNKTISKKTELHLSTEDIIKAVVEYIKKEDGLEINPTQVAFYTEAGLVDDVEVDITLVEKL